MANRRLFADGRQQLLAGGRSAEVRAHQRPAAFFSRYSGQPRGAKRTDVGWVVGFARRELGGAGHAGPSREQANGPSQRVATGRTPPQPRRAPVQPVSRPIRCAARAARPSELAGCVAGAQPHPMCHSGSPRRREVAPLTPPPPLKRFSHLTKLVWRQPSKRGKWMVPPSPLSLHPCCRWGQLVSAGGLSCRHHIGYAQGARICRVCARVRATRAFALVPLPIEHASLKGFAAVRPDTRDMRTTGIASDHRPTEA